MTLEEFRAAKRKVDQLQDVKEISSLVDVEGPGVVYPGNLFIEGDEELGFTLCIENCSFDGRGEEGLAMLEEELYNWAHVDHDEY